VAPFGMTEVASHHDIVVADSLDYLFDARIVGVRRM
jgi:hypothetical protein